MKRMVLGIVCCMLLLCACAGYFDMEPEQYENKTEDLVVVGVSQVGSESVWRTANTLSLQQALSE